MNIDRVNSELKKQITNIINHELNDPRISSAGMITVMKVQATQDLDNCKVFLSVFGEEKKGQEVIKLLREAAGYIKKLLFVRMKIRKIPNLIFQLDESIDYAYKISALLKSTSLSEHNQSSKEGEE